MDSRDPHFRTGQPVWVVEPDGSSRAAEYIGEGERRRHRSGAPNALVIFVDASGAEVVEVSRLRPRQVTGANLHRAARARDAAARRAQRSRGRRQGGAQRASELETGGPDPRQSMQDAVVRAYTAAETAKEAEACAAEALDGAAEAWERAARAEQRLAEVAERCGDARAPAHRIAAQEAFQRATGAREAAVAARQRRPPALGSTESSFSPRS
ncbi:MAG: hypothetical protein JO244_06935 [Solirubrobacterales bacterium]|nr:hypothetical protein [Solirubrobacterales bacterium]